MPLSPKNNAIPALVYGVTLYALKASMYLLETQRKFCILYSIVKGPCHEMNHLLPSPFRVFRKFAEIFPSQGVPPVSRTPAVNAPAVNLLPM